MVFRRSVKSRLRTRIDVGGPEIPYVYEAGLPRAKRRYRAFVIVGLLVALALLAVFTILGLLLREGTTSARGDHRKRRVHRRHPMPHG